MHTIKVYHQWGQFLSEQYIPEIRTILLHLLYFLIRFEYCYIYMIMCVRVWLLLLMTLCYKNKEFQLPAVQFFIHQSPSCYICYWDKWVLFIQTNCIIVIQNIFNWKKRLSVWIWHQFYQHRFCYWFDTINELWYMYMYKIS